MGICFGRKERDTQSRLGGVRASNTMGVEHQDETRCKRWPCPKNHGHRTNGGGAKSFHPSLGIYTSQNVTVGAAKNPHVILISWIFQLLDHFLGKSGHSPNRRTEGFWATKMFNMKG